MISSHPDALSKYLDLYSSTYKNILILAEFNKDRGAAYEVFLRKLQFRKPY